MQVKLTALTTAGIYVNQTWTTPGIFRHNEKRECPAEQDGLAAPFTFNTATQDTTGIKNAIQTLLSQHVYGSGSPMTLSFAYSAAGKFDIVLGTKVFNYTATVSLLAFASAGP